MSIIKRYNWVIVEVWGRNFQNNSFTVTKPQATLLLNQKGFYQLVWEGPHEMWSLSILRPHMSHKVNTGKDSISGDTWVYSPKLCITQTKTQIPWMKVEACNPQKRNATTKIRTFQEKTTCLGNTALWTPSCFHLANPYFKSLKMNSIWGVHQLHNQTLTSQTMDFFLEKMKNINRICQTELFSVDFGNDAIFLCIT